MRAAAARPTHLRLSLDQFHWNLLHNLNSKSFQGGCPFRAVGEQPDASQIQVGEDLRSDADFTLGLANIIQQRRQFLSAVKAERCSVPGSLDRESLRSLMQVDQCAASFLCNAAQGTFQGRVAFTAGGAEDVAHQAMRMHTDENRLVAAFNVAADERHVRLAAVYFALVGDEAKLSVARLD